MTTPTRQDVKAILDYLAAHAINVNQANQQLAALGFTQKHLGEQFVSGAMSYADIYTLLGV